MHSSSSLPDIKQVSVNHRDSYQLAVSRHFRSDFKTHSFKYLLFSFLSFGVYPYKRYKQSRRQVMQALAARKLSYFRSLQEHIEAVRQKQTHSDPRQALNAIFMQVQSEKVDESEGALEFRAIYYPSELLLFITNPVRDVWSLRLHRLRSRRHLDYLRMWNELKKKARINQYRQIQNINFCSKTLKEEYYLTPAGIHDRLPRTSVCRKNKFLITRFRHLGKAFQEIVLAYQDFEELKESNRELYELIDTLAKTSRKDVETLQTYLSSRYLPRDLPLANRRQLIQLGNHQEVLYHMSEEQQFGLCALILNKYQWDFLLSIQEVSEVTLGLLDWAFEECPSTIERKRSFVEQMQEEKERFVREDPSAFPTLSSRTQESDTFRLMTTQFADELSREWPSLRLYEGEKLVYEEQRTNSFDLERLLSVYEAVQQFAGEDDKLCILLQKALSQLGKRAFQSAIEKGVVKLLGQKSEYFLPILSNSAVHCIKKNATQVEVRYEFEQLIMKKGERQRPCSEEKYLIISQPLIQVKGQWSSPEAQIKVGVKREVE